jgi:hypothetical protein
MAFNTIHFFAILKGCLKHTSRFGRKSEKSIEFSDFEVPATNFFGPNTGRYQSRDLKLMDKILSIDFKRFMRE